MTTEPDPARLYLTSSSLMTRILKRAGHEQVIAAADAWIEDGGVLVSSRLLGLECTRVTIRERLQGREIEAEVRDFIANVTLLPVIDEVWERATAIEQHVPTLDAIHLATCELIEATLLTAGLDSGIRAAAEARGIPTV